MSNLPEQVANAKEAIKEAKDTVTLDLLRIKYLGKKGRLTQLMRSLRDLVPEDRAAAGLLMNQAKQELWNAINTRKNVLNAIALNEHLASETIDVSLPGRQIKNGGLHPVTQSINRINTFFAELGFSITTGQEIEDDYHNFDALNIPKYHPARTEHDTFWFDKTRLLRTQTSSVQIRTMKNQKPPIRIVSPGRVYRNDYDQTHTPMFHQMEGLIIDYDISFANLKGIMHDFLHYFFEENLHIRFRPSYFPFTEPSAEIDVMGKNGKWLEVIGCGMVHPNVLRKVGNDPEIYSGFAFGMGMERLTMLRHSITDLRLFFENDLRFLKQFK